MPSSCAEFPSYGSSTKTFLQLQLPVNQGRELLLWSHLRRDQGSSHSLSTEQGSQQCQAATLYLSFFQRKETDLPRLKASHRPLQTRKHITCLPPPSLCCHFELEIKSRSRLSCFLKKGKAGLPGPTARVQVQG